MSRDPDLSIVYATRDDAYARLANQNLTRTIEDVRDKASSAGIRLEIVVVDWSPEDGRSMASLMSSAGSAGCTLVTVNHETAEPYIAAAGRPFVEYVAKSAGVANCSGHQVLVTNSDIRLSSEALIACVERPFGNASFLRVDRTDYLATPTGGVIPLRVHIRHGATESDPISLDVADTSIGTLPTSETLPGESREGDFIIGPEGGLNGHFLRGLHTNASGDFIAAPLEAWKQADGFSTKDWTTTMGDALMCARLLGAGFRQVILTGSRHALHLEHPRSGGASGAWDKSMWSDFKALLRNTASGEEEGTRDSLTTLRNETQVSYL